MIWRWTAVNNGPGYYLRIRNHKHWYFLLHGEYLEHLYRVTQSKFLRLSHNLGTILGLAAESSTVIDSSDSVFECHLQPFTHIHQRQSEHSSVSSVNTILREASIVIDPHGRRMIESECMLSPRSLIQFHSHKTPMRDWFWLNIIYCQTVTAKQQQKTQLSHSKWLQCSNYTYY